jgi:syntaxin 5
VEGTINEIKGIFTELSVLTMQQDEMIRSIEDDLEDVSVNVEEGHKQLLQYLPKVTQNRWLYLKIFGVLLFFMIVFLIFFV